MSHTTCCKPFPLFLPPLSFPECTTPSTPVYFPFLPDYYTFSLPTSSFRYFTHSPCLLSSAQKHQTHSWQFPSLLQLYFPSCLFPTTQSLSQLLLQPLATHYHMMPVTFSSDINLAVCNIFQIPLFYLIFSPLLENILSPQPFPSFSQNPLLYAFLHFSVSYPPNISSSLLFPSPSSTEVCSNHHFLLPGDTLYHFIQLSSQW